MSLSLEQATGLNHVHAVATPGANLTGLSGAATTHSTALFGFTINGIAYSRVVQTGVATPATSTNPDGTTGTAAALALAPNQSRVYVWGVNAAGTTQVFAGPAVTWPNSSGTATGSPIPLQFPSIPSNVACFAMVVISAGSNASAFAFGAGGSNWNATGITVGTVVNLAGWMPAVPPSTP